ncbi:MAG: helix-hairpin-helix domain-containing protein [Thermodesulfobacteriota bacterium]|jgi:competence protein ComEA|nr:helix-hairpin-helix domain-containing protein [Thermodesulfobacteriota bacterium]
MNARQGVLLLIGAILTFLLLSQGRLLFSAQEPPVLPPAPSSQIIVEIAAGVPRPGIYQFSDGLPWLAVISLTNLDCVRPALQSGIPDASIANGQRLAFFCNSLNKLEVETSWMSAAHRMALGVSLHPDRMSVDDWQALPGIGPRLAERIEQDRQLNGDFGQIDRLRRVKGIGAGRISQWQNFFCNRLTP